ncbi:Nif3-like dinuclear metal center hexameric protein [Fructobacillus evanidus]|uniref:GTP cyclohydrolase 1 type 2 homolog n=1 Tax=Fructobacillus evanidus TaxID=3064281 RepID=A0ABN9YZQ7_9LACO|nr:NIF3 family (NIF3) [Fructobacillus sp. LMG 32999]CAK1246036.1 NIF3 family (NIF3) [Fructobacillus sp. LMG 32999]CAK1250914.1 NIF3 family (NIF3) [Fructobacillus sp. LMG 32999]CAK1251319.1 NIF3 family (NIF3) [Fructobacillus sp. LMG 32999]CAK1251531.1 NIF3 family (NIF3) [Fructobacillus sp. LMG 32999]
MVKASELIEQIEAFAPKSWAEPDDPTGLQIGQPEQEIHRVLTTLDVRPEVVQEAIDLGADFIWAHHEAMFRPAKNLDLSDPQNAMYALAIKNNIVIYASHTNLDAAAGGLNDWLCQAFGIENQVPLLPSEGDQHGMGRIGDLTIAVTMADFAKQVKAVCQVDAVRLIANDANKVVKRVAVLGGDGGKFWKKAQEAGADLYLTADLYYHVGHDILAADFAVLDPDHHMEALAKEPMAKKVQEWFDGQLPVTASQKNTDPYTYF